MSKQTVSIIDAHRRICDLLAAHEPAPSRVVVDAMVRLTSLPAKIIEDATPCYSGRSYAARKLAEHGKSTPLVNSLGEQWPCEQQPRSKS